MRLFKEAGSNTVHDLTDCDREPIHIPEAIQPHGVLIGLSPADLRVTAVSENVPRAGGAAACDLLGCHASRLIDRRSLEQVEMARLAPGQSLLLGGIGLGDTGGSGRGEAGWGWRGVLHAQDDVLLLEAERCPADSWSDAPAQFELFQAGMARLQAASAFAETARSLVAEVRRLSGFGRVVFYRFEPDWTGAVTAEDRDDGMPSFLGLHFPASDIPVQARALYARHVTRLIPDVDYRPVSLLHRREAPLDLSLVGLRSVSPVHLAYLRNMGVGASMSLSMLHHGRLWGMVACHHATPHAVLPERVKFCSLLADWAVARFSLIEEAEVAQRDVAVKTIERRLVQQAAAGEDKSVGLLQTDLLLDNRAALLELLGASGVALCAGGSCMALGEVPPPAALQNLLSGLAARGPHTLVTDHLSAEFPAAAVPGGPAGLLAVPLSQGQDDFMIWFRPEVARTVIWAGHPAKRVEEVDGQVRHAPRHSFAAWREQLLGWSRPWVAADVAAAHSLRDVVVEIVARRATLIQRMNQQLMRSNEELESFASIASHDLKEPLRQIEMFGTLLQRAFGKQGDVPEKVERWFSGISSSAQRLRGLIDHLAQYSRLGSEAQPFAAADTGAVLAEALEDFSGQIAACGCTVEIGRLPVVVCDGIQIRQVFQNLIGNALKYRHPNRTLTLRIDASFKTEQGADLPDVQFRVEDNGIGFEARHAEQIFRPFERLHSSEAYEGSGLGLAICRKVIDRHGGTITAHGRPGEGAVFIFTLPQRDSFVQDARGA